MATTLHRPVCDLLGCTTPIVLAGMGGAARRGGARTGLRDGGRGQSFQRLRRPVALPVLRRANDDDRKVRRRLPLPVAQTERLRQLMTPIRAAANKLTTRGATRAYGFARPCHPIAPSTYRTAEKMACWARLDSSAVCLSPLVAVVLAAKNSRPRSFTAPAAPKSP